MSSIACGVVFLVARSIVHFNIYVQYISEMYSYYEAFDLILYRRTMLIVTSRKKVEGAEQSYV